MRFRTNSTPFTSVGVDSGESEALAYLCNSADQVLILSGDAFVYRVLGRLNRSDQGISLEETLKMVGLQRGELPYSCTKTFRDSYTK